jgi:hypothetical protein
LDRLLLYSKKLLLPGKSTLAYSGFFVGEEEEKSMVMLIPRIDIVSKLLRIVETQALQVRNIL